MSPAVTAAGPRSVETHRDGLVGHRRDDDVLEVQDDVGDVLGDTGDGVELVERVVETHRGDRCAGDRREQGATQGVAERVTEAGLERTDGETLAIVGLLTESFDGGALHDEHWCQDLSTTGIRNENARNETDYLE